ncbi:hypothetical protein J6590_076792 [Homalodisca vitripennis]|nr:hypothetical protein J6590_076792 [Homalodisca vitripennis]
MKWCSHRLIRYTIGCTTMFLRRSKITAEKNLKRIIKQRRAWLLFGWVNAERSCPCKQCACPAIG